jgi:hypothetical protein
MATDRISRTQITPELRAAAAALRRRGWERPWDEIAGYKARIAELEAELAKARSVAAPSMVNPSRGIR